MTTTQTHCPYCALQCGMNLVTTGPTLSVAARPDFPTNRGGLCQKGWTSTDLLTREGRITAPLARDSRAAPLREVSWDDAYSRIISALTKTQAAHGRDAVGVFGGGGLTNEKAYLLGKFARVALKTANIDYNGRFCMSSAAAAGTKAFGIDRGLPFPLEDIGKTETILLIGGNPAETMPPIMQYFDTSGPKRNLIVVDPRLTPTAKSASIHLQLTPGTDLALANGLLNIAVEEGLVDAEFIAERTSGFAEVQRCVKSYWPDRVERITGIPVAVLRRTVRMLAESKSAMVLTARGPEQQSKGTDTVLAFINLALALGKVGRPLSGYGCLTGQGNGQGGREHGQKADQLPGYRRIDNPEHRADVARVWGIDPADLPGPGKSAYEMLDALGCDGGVRALIVVASNVAVSAPRAAHVRERLASLDFLVTADFFLSETAALSDVVLPTTQWAEEEGTMTNLEGRVLLRKRACAPPDGVKSDLEILSDLAGRLNAPSAFPPDPRAVFQELRAASAGGPADYSGITYDGIENENGMFWPCPGEGHPGTPRLFLERFAHSDGRAKFFPVTYRSAAEEPDFEYPYYFTTGRVMLHYQSGNQTRRIPALNEMAPEPFVEMHPSVAQRLGITDGEMVVVESRRGSATMRARITPTIRHDTLFAPFHWGGRGSANLLTNPALDPTSRMPEFKVCAARLARAG